MCSTPKRQPTAAPPRSYWMLTPWDSSAIAVVRLARVGLGVEALHRFVEREPLRRVHECVFGVLALESEPVDPRL
jgi:protein phosphatase